MSTDKGKSDVWKFMSKTEDGKKCTCNLCSKSLAFHGGTTNLREHLSSAHPREYSQASAKQKKSMEKMQPKITSLFQKPCDSSKSKKITDLLVDMVCRDMRPLSIVNGHGFKELLHFLEPNYQIPSNSQMTSLINQKHRTGKEKLKKFLQSASSIAVTTDSWTSCCNDSYLTITAHFINDWKLVACVLQTTEMDEKHSAENLAERLITTLVDDWGLQKSQVCAVVHDNAANMMRMNTLLNEELECPTWTSIPCTAHSLQLAINAGLTHPPVHTVIAACRKLVGHFKHSTRAVAELRKQQENMQLPQHELIQDVATRWNSVLYMCERALEQRWPMSKVLSDPIVTPNRDHRNLDLQNHHWEVMAQLVKVLKPLEVATTLFCYEEQVCLSAVLPIIFRLVDVLNTKDEADLPATVRVKELIKESIVKRWKVDNIQVWYKVFYQHFTLKFPKYQIHLLE
jgi:zinc finger BED domain-containing protein 1 (E3 SUMO-protein ligase ZBED1)